MYISVNLRNSLDVYSLYSKKIVSVTYNKELNVTVCDLIYHERTEHLGIV